MAKRRPGRSRVHSRKANRTKDISDHTLMMMVILVLVVSMLSATMYVYAFYGGGYTALKSQGTESLKVEQQTVSGVATLQIIKPPKGSK